MSEAPTRDPYHDERADEEALQRAMEVFRAYREGVLQFDEHVRKVQFIADPSDGRLIVSVPEATFLSAHHVLFVPEEDDDALQLLLSVQRIEESAVTDRWMAYHGEPEEVRWAACWVDGARHGPWVFDGDAFMANNALAGVESKLCRLVNERRAELIDACVRTFDLDIREPTCVGVDDRGMYVRVRFGVMRIEFESTAKNEANATEQIEKILSDG